MASDRSLRDALLANGTRVVLIVLLLATVASVCAETPLGPNWTRTSVKDYADQLYADLEYYRAITEYRRFLSYFPDDPSTHDVQIRVMDCFLLGSEFSDAIHWSQRIVAGGPPSPVAARARLGMAHALIRLDNPAKAREAVSQLTGTEDLDLRARALYATALSFVREGAWSSATDALTAIPAGSEYEHQGGDARQLIAAESEIADKSPGLAALLNILPGGGYLYIDRPQTAIAAALVNTLGALATYSALSHSQPGLAATVGLISVGWYTGGIYGARVGAMRANQNRRLQAMERLYRY
jgi:hypothetical protein